VIAQQWGSNESATFTYTLPATTTVTDVLGQQRRYTLTANDVTNVLADRAHVTEARELNVPVWNAASFGKLPLSITAGAPSTTTPDRVRTFTYEEGGLKTSKLDGVGETTIDYENATAIGRRVHASTATPQTSGPSDFIPPSLPIARTYEYQSGANFLEGMMAGGKRIESVEPHRGNTAPVSVNSDIRSTQTFDTHGMLTDSVSSGGTDAASKGAKGKIEYFDETAPPHMRGLPHIVHEGDGADELKTTFDYRSATQTTSIDARGVITTTDFDAWQRPVHVNVSRIGDALSLDQTWRYDNSGRLVETSEQKGTGFVTTRYTYDVVGRRLSTTTTGIATVGSVTIAHDRHLPPGRRDHDQ
jgi:YD repeat-containing protein